jgi:UPF0755 protein
VKKTLQLVFLLLLCLVFGVGFYFYEFAQTPGSQSKTLFELSKGMKPQEVSALLERSGAVTGSQSFLWLGKLTGSWGSIKAAEYEIPANSTPLQIFKILKSGIGIQHPLLVKEGDNIYQIADSFSAAGLGTKEEVLSLMKSPELIRSLGLAHEGIQTLEGYIFPNTYFYDKRESVEGLIRKMVQAFIKNWTPEMSDRAKLFKLNRKQAITLASIIEKETGASEERPIISSVFHNRLNRKMKIQSDPTTIYGIWSEYQGNLHKSDLLRPTPYNTYTIPALPIGPISNVHLDSIKAALYPAETDYLFFVSRNDGTHVFSHTYEEHQLWVKRLQLDPSAREGKSWRNLKTRN